MNRFGNLEVISWIGVKLMKFKSSQPLRVSVTMLVIMLSFVFLASCGGKDTPISVPEGAQAGDLAGTEDCTYVANDVEYAAECSLLVAQENRVDPGSNLIAIPVIRVPATGENPAEPIFYFAGGPGGPNLHFQQLEGLVENHDIVQVGYRGVDGSVVLECPEVNQAIKKANPDFLSHDALSSIGNAWVRCSNRIESEGIDLDGYTMIETIEDNESARLALGYERINLLGGSYGTRLEQIYMWMYPESLHRVAMISVNPPGNMVWEPDYIDALIRYDADLCAKDLDCSARTSDLAKTISDVAHSTPDRWLFLPIDPGLVRAVAFMNLFYRSSAAQTYDAFLAAEAGDPSGLAMFSVVGEFIFPSANTWGFAASIAASADFDPNRDYCLDMNPPDSIMGAPVSQFYWCSLQLGGWPTAFIPDEFRQVQPSDVSTLMVSGSVDFSTPMMLATNELLPVLGNAEQVILSEFGHTDDIWVLQPEATRHLLTSFFDTGRVDDSHFTYQPMNFDVGLMSFPLIAKISVVVITLILIGILALVWFIFRRIRLRKNLAVQAQEQ